MRAVAVTLFTLAVLVGCEPAKPTAPTTKTAPTAAAAADDDHDHGPGPHQGTVFDFGKWHAEFCIDHGKQEATVYILSGNLKRPVAIAADKLTLALKEPQLQIELKAVPLESDPAGKASRFVGTAPALGKEQEFAGTVGGAVDGKPYRGEFAETAHDHK